jgi:serine/threonine protein kinase
VDSKSAVCFPHFFSFLENPVSDKKIERLQTDSTFGIVEKIQHKSSNMFLVWKKIPVLKENKKRIQEEALIGMAVQSPYVVKVFDTFEDDDDQYIVMEFCDGGTLRDYMTAQQKYVHMSERVFSFPSFSFLFFPFFISPLLLLILSRNSEDLRERFCMA